MQPFPNAQNFALHNAMFANQNIYHQSSRNGIDVLREASAPEAAFDSDSRRCVASCFPGTRSQHIEDIVKWGTAQSGCPIYRMTGPAGVGKTAIAQTCAEKLGDLYQLGASFFFKANVCDDYTRFFTSISHQLSSKSVDYYDLLDQKLKRDPNLVHKRLRSQFKGLIVEPLREMERRGKPFGGEVIIIDGLDECKDKDAQREIIEIIIESAVAQTTPFYWAFFSRPEPQIQAAFADRKAESLCISTFLPISRGIDREIELYLRNGLQNILHRRGIATSVPWPTEQDMHALVSAAQGLYVYAATVLRFVGRTDTQYDPQELLRMVVRGSAPGGSIRSPFEELDAFYALILRRVRDEFYPSIQLILSYRSSYHTGGLMRLHFLCNILRFSEIKIKMLCGELVGIYDALFPLNLGTVSWGTSYFAKHIHLWKSEPVNREFGLLPCHKSFIDFITDPTRSGPFCINTPAARNNLFRHILQVQVDYSGNYSFNSELGGLTFTGSNLITENVYIWPYCSEKLRAICTADIVAQSTGCLLDCFFPYDDIDSALLRELGDLDHRTVLQVLSLFSREQILHLATAFNFPCSIRSFHGTAVCSICHQNMSAFDVAKFRRGLSRLEAAEVFQRYLPDSTSLELPLFRCDSDGNLLSGLYIKGRGQRSTFFYWIIDLDMEYFRTFETADLAEGERIFREEIFELWDQEGKFELVDEGS